MKKILYITSLFSLFLLSSCENDDKFLGTPEKYQDITTITGTISTTATAVVTGQSIDFTATLPQAFEGDVEVEATAKLSNGTLTKSSITIPAGQTTGSGRIEMPSAENGFDLPFNNTLELSLSGIELSVADSGKHYLLNSNVISLDCGDSTIPAILASTVAPRLRVRFDWKGPYGEGENDLDLYILRVEAGGGQTVVGTGFTGTRYEDGSILNSAPDATYIVAAESFTLTYGSELGSIPYRYTLRFPDTSVKTFAGTFTDFTEGDFVEVLQIVKTTVDGVVSYNVTQL